MLPHIPAAEAAPALSEIHRSFADEFLAALDFALQPGSKVRVLDVGAGTARIPIEICTRRVEMDVVAVDSSLRILELAQANINRAGLGESIRVDQADACSLPYANAAFDAVISNALLHHLQRRRDALGEMLRVVRPGGILFVRGSLRQPDAAKIARVLAASSGGTSEDQLRVYQTAFHRAPNLDEVRELACAAGLPSEWVRQTGSRHWIIRGRLPDSSGGGFPLKPLHTAAAVPRV